MTLREQIKSYLKEQSKYVVNLSDVHADHIIALVQNYKPKRGFVKCHQWNGQIKSHVFFVQKTALEDEIRTAIFEANQTAPVLTDLFRYDCFSSTGASLGQIYSTNISLFK